MRKPTPEVYRWLAAQPPTPIIELPMGIDSPELWYQFYSKFHWQRIVNGYSGFWPPTYDDITAIANGFPSSESIGMLRALGVEHIIVHDEYLTPDQRRRIFQNIPAFTADLDEVTAFGRDHVYRLKPRALRWDDLRVTTFFSRLAITGQEYRAFVIARDAGSDTFIASLAKMVQVTAHWTDERGHTVAQTMQMPLPFLVQPGVTVVPISLAAPAAGRYRLRIEPSGSGDLPSRTCLLAQAVASEVEVLDKPPSASVSPSIQLVDFETDRASYAPGETIFLTLRWKALGLTTEDYTVFTHLVDAQGHLWGQKDNPPLQNTFPTSQWLPGEEVPDPYAIVIDPQAPTGEYRIEVGMYRFSDMKRIDVRDLLGSATATIALGPVEIR
jgi:hypothetical protein